MSQPVFAAAVEAYVRAGWPCILPVPPAAKYPPPTGYTGAAGRDTDPVQLVRWAGTHAEHSIALRMPDGVVGIDVDEYAKGSVTKHGATSMATALAAWGPLPSTWRSTARDPDGLSGIYFYRVPPGRYATTVGRDVEVIQRHHRYAVVAPSPHPEVGTAYRWYLSGLDGVHVHADPGQVPNVAELPELPAAWVEGLAAGAATASAEPASYAEGQHLLDELLMDHRPPCSEIHSAVLTALGQLAAADAGSRHDTAITRVHHLVQLAAAGHPGVGGALGALAEQWEALTEGEGRTGEWERMMLGSARKAVTSLGQTGQVAIDPCLVISAVGVPAQAPADYHEVGSQNGNEPYTPIEPVRLWSVREVIGVHAFDPMADLDQSLAHAVLERLHPALRYAWDSGQWLMRGPEVWSAAPELSRWAVSQAAELMPRGDPTAEKGSPEQVRAARRARLQTDRSAGAVAGKMRALTAAGTHPAALLLTDLDAEPELLWAGYGAGSMAYDLRRSTEQPTPAGVDPGTPHLHAAAVAPVAGPTPLWDAFTEAVWPEPELRAWALRVLSIALTGYPDAALPILLGPTRRGKSQVVHLLMSVLGSYAHAADPRLLGAADSAHASIVYALRGRRLSFVDEGPREGRWATERLKQLTGGTALTGNRMRENPVTFQPSHTLVLTANDEPHLLDPAIRARVRLIPCEGDPALVLATRAAIGQVRGQAWRTEAPRVLAAMMRQAAAWLADPDSALTVNGPVDVRERAEEIAAGQDPIRSWVETETEPDEAGERGRVLYEAFVSWCRNGNTHPGRIPSEVLWSRGLTELGYPGVKREAGHYRRLRLRHVGWSGVLPLAPASNGSALPLAIASTEARLPTVTVADAAPIEAANPAGSCRVLQGNPAAGHMAADLHKSLTHSGDLQGLQGIDQSTDLPELSTRTKPDISPSTPSPTLVVPPPNPADPAADPLNVGSDLHVYTLQGSPKTLQEPCRTLQDGEPAPEPLTKTEQTKITKAAAREAARLAAIEEASGRRWQLPVIVDRAGTIVEVDLPTVERVMIGSGATFGELTVDVETTGRPVGHPEYALRTIQLGTAEVAVVLDAADTEQAALARVLLAQPEILHAHSATADLVPLANAGLLDHEDAWHRMVDTVIAAKLADPASTGSDPGLKQLAAAVLGDQATSTSADAARAELFRAGKWLSNVKPETPIARSGWAQVDPTCTTMIRYAAADVLDTAALAEALPQPEPEVYVRERLVQRMTARVAERGLQLDAAKVAELTEHHTRAEAGAAARVRTYGVDNPGSDQQVGQALLALGATLPLTPTGRPSVAAGVLDPLRSTAGPIGELVNAVLAQRHHDTQLCLFLRPWAQLTQAGDGRARPTVYTLGADTGRMSCVRPNLQQVPRVGGMRGCITADPGHLLVSADFAGIELRVAAALSGCTSLRAIIEAGRDLHGEIAAQVYGPDWTKADRYDAKRMVFARLYGSGVPGLARSTGTSESVAAAVVETMDYLTPGVAEWSRQMRDHVKAGRTRYPAYSGRVIHLPARTPHAAPNYAIQGTARELLVDALIRWSSTRWADAVLLPVHDELVVHVPEAEAADATAALVECMTTELMGVPIKAEASAPSFSWADAS